MAAVARVAVVSNLPQLDKLFDYLVPIEFIDRAQPGSRVKVPFGNSAKTYDAFIFELDNTSDFGGKLASIQEVVGDRPFLSKELMEALKEIALRSAGSLGEILKIAVPAHMPRSYKAHLVGVHDEKDLPEAPTSQIDEGFIASLV
jgi:primosomal protein N' (replication factor Y)